MIGNQNLVRVAVVHEPREAIPLQGTWVGAASDHLAMNVKVKVTAAADAGVGRGARAGMGRSRRPAAIAAAHDWPPRDGRTELFCRFILGRWQGFRQGSACAGRRDF